MFYGHPYHNINKRSAAPQKGASRYDRGKQAARGKSGASGKSDYHSGYGHSGYGHSGHSGFGGYSHGFGYNDCCPLVFDPLTLIAFFGFLAAGTYLLQITITMTIMGRRKKRNISKKFQDILFAGREKKYINCICQFLMVFQ